MATNIGVRGANPIWSEFDLAGKLFDDNFWMYVLQNEIPYNNATVYHYPDLTAPWNNPIQFLGNGTLPNDIFFVPGVFYRLEFRQNNGIDPPSQSDPLIYLVENYSVGSSGGTPPIDTVAFSTSNQVTNPQFALVNFGLPPLPSYTFTGTSPAPIQVGPGWFLELTGTGSVTMAQVPLNDSEPNPSNAPYALRLLLSGWDVDGVILRQRFEENGMLWANKIVSTTVTARIQGAPQDILARLIDSNGTPLATVLPKTTVDANFNEFKEQAPLGDTTNPDLPPSAYIDYQLFLPSNVDIYVTSIQLVAQDLPVQPAFEQDSINRQIDHTYNTAYPIVPVGTVIDFGGFDTPSHYLFCDGTAYSRTDYNLLFQAITKTETVSLNSSVTITVVNGAIYRIGMFVEGTGIPAATTISNIVGNTITLSAAATVTASSLLRFFAAGNGNGTTTFNVYDLRDRVVAGSGGTGILALASNGTGAVFGDANRTLVAANLPPHQHTITTQTGSSPPVEHFVSTGAGVTGNTFLTGDGPGTSTPFSIVQPTMFLRKCIRFE